MKSGDIPERACAYFTNNIYDFEPCESSASVEHDGITNCALSQPTACDEQHLAAVTNVMSLSRFHVCHIGAQLYCMVVGFVVIIAYTELPHRQTEAVSLKFKSNVFVWFV